MVLLAHISDPHLGPLPPASAADLASKRAFGYVNWRRNRGRIYADSVVDALIADMRAAAPDHIAVTGDLVNLALPAEFDRARRWLHAIGGPERVTVIPGNHDAYVPGALDMLNHAWREFMSGDDAGNGTFPFVRRRGPLTLIGVSTAVPTPPLMATGTIGVEQAAALARALSDLGREGACRVVLIHHSPLAGVASWFRRLTDASRFRDVIARHGAELVLHGHDHYTSVGALPGPDGPVPVVGAAAASVKPGVGRAGSYNLVEIAPASGGWSLAMRERRLTAGNVVETVMEKRLAG